MKDLSRAPLVCAIGSNEPMAPIVSPSSSSSDPPKLMPGGGLKDMEAQGVFGRPLCFVRANGALLNAEVWVQLGVLTALDAFMVTARKNACME